MEMVSMKRFSVTTNTLVCMTGNFASIYRANQTRVPNERSSCYSWNSARVFGTASSTVDWTQRDASKSNEEIEGYFE